MSVEEKFSEKRAGLKTPTKAHVHTLNCTLFISHKVVLHVIILSYLLSLLPLSFCWDPVGRRTLGGPPRPILTGSCRFGEQACHVMEGCQGNVSSSCRLRL